MKQRFKNMAVEFLGYSEQFCSKNQKKSFDIKFFCPQKKFWTRKMQFRLSSRFLFLGVEKYFEKNLTSFAKTFFHLKTFHADDERFFDNPVNCFLTPNTEVFPSSSETNKIEFETPIFC